MSNYVRIDGEESFLILKTARAASNTPHHSIVPLVINSRQRSLLERAVV